VFPPAALQGNSGYFFFVASGTHNGNPDVGMIVLSSAGPNQNSQWTMDFDSGYGYYPNYGFGTVFLAPVRQKHCPDIPSMDVTLQDPTFDLDYAAGSVVSDPTSRPGSLLMLYEGVNDCFANAGGTSQPASAPNGTGAYSTIGAATSADYGRTWPTYASTTSFAAVPLPYATPYPITNPIQGPNAPDGAFGPSVCVGNDCSQTPPATYGRYAVLSPPLSLPGFMTTGQALGPLNNPPLLGDAEPAAFVDEFTPGTTTYLYVVHGYAPGGSNGDAGGPALGRKDVLTISRAQLNGGTERLQFSKWDGNAFAWRGVGGAEAPIFPQVLQNGPATACEASSQSMHAGSISYLENTQQYLLVFVCESTGDPDGSDTRAGASWFYSTSSSLSDMTQWSVPQEITGSWSSFEDSCPGPPAGKGPGNHASVFS
jgi:hypothetical protein